MKITAPLRAIVIAHLFYCVALAGEADYTLDDSFWNEESPVGEVERLLKEYRQNQELVRRIGGHYYQIIYPVQLRHHEKMGISTREVSPPKTGQRISRPHEGTDGGGGFRARTRTGKHFHRTSLLIKAFNHKFRLDLELNSQLLSPNIQQKHYHVGGYLVDGNRHDIEHCYYHGTVKDYPGASAAFHTCNGVSGVIHVGNETFVIHPFYGGDLSKHPHVIFEARTKANKGCANSGNLDSWRAQSRRTKHLSGIIEDDLIDVLHPNVAERYKRDVRDTTKYIETAIVVDKAMFEKRNGSTRAEVIHDAIQVANIADLYFRTLNTRVSVVYIETWGKNQAQIDGSKDISKAISNFNDYTSRNLFKIEKDTTQLLTGETFVGGEAGMAVPETVCTPKAVGISVDINVYEPHLLAGTMAHMIGHNIGMGHDDGREECFCRDWHGCIMAQSIVGLENVQPYKFSECSKKDYVDALRTGHGLCLFNKPNEPSQGRKEDIDRINVDVPNYRGQQFSNKIEPIHRNCGNKIVEEDEECDCGTFEECLKDPCCEGITCKLKKEAECAEGMCCDNCKLKERGIMCRDTTNECDLPEFCDGENGQCPMDVYKKNGIACGQTKLAVAGYCFQGECPTLNLQCEKIWGFGGAAADRQCYEQFNSKGSINGHCGREPSGNYVKCDLENVQCGTLQCREGERQPVKENVENQLYSRTIISIKGIEYECKATSGQPNSDELPGHGLVKDGTPCGDNLVCVNQTCVSLFPHIDQTKCPTNKNNKECSDQGVCTNLNRCHCELGWGGIDCSQTVLYVTAAPPPPNAGPTVDNTVIKMEKKETPYGLEESKNKISTLTMVIILVVIVKCVFISFASLAVCYRRKTTRNKYDPPYSKKPIAKAYAGTASTANHHQSVEEVSLDGSSKLMFGNQTGFRDHKMQQIRRLTGSGSEEDQAHSEKGILKKHGYGLVLGDQMKDKWGEDGHSDNLELIAQQDGTLAGGSGTAASEVERTLKSLNGYHEDILEALRNAASHRGTGTGNTPVGSGSLSEEMLRKTLQECATASLNYSDYKRGSKSSSKENICDIQQSHILIDSGGLGSGVGGGVNLGQTSSLLHDHRHSRQHQPTCQEDDEAPSTGPLRIRNLEDLIRQLEHHSSRHMSPSGSEDIRMSETEADRHYRLDSSAACSESSQGSNQQIAQSQKTATIHPSYSSRCRPRSDDESRFVSYGRYRHQPPPTTSRHHQHQSHSPHAFGHHTHHSHGHHGPHSSHHSSHTHLHQDDEGIYESADHHDGRTIDPRIDRETPDSESDDFIQAQQQLARWASEDVVSVVVLDQQQQQNTATISPGAHSHHSTAGLIGHQHMHQQQSKDINNSGNITTTTTTNQQYDPTIIMQSHQISQQQQSGIVHHHGVTNNNNINNNNNIQQSGEHQQSINNTMTGPLTINTNGINVNQRDYYPSPASTETESSGSVIQPVSTLTRRNHILVDTTIQQQNQQGEGQLMENGRYPEYKH